MSIGDIVMKLREIKKYLGLCQCKKCRKQFVTIVVMHNKKYKYYLAYLCEHHAYEALLDPFLED